MNLDVRTIGILSAITPLILGLVMAYYWLERKAYDGFGRWVLANFCFFAGFLLISLRSIVPDFLSIIFGNVIIVYATILIFEGSQLFFGRSAFKGTNYAILILYLLLQYYFTYIQPDINTRIILISFVLFILLLSAGYSLFRNPFEKLKKISRLAAAFFLITALIPLTRGIYTLLQSNPLDMFTDKLSPWYSITLSASNLIWTFTFFLLNSARLEMELENAQQELSVMAYTDPLTGLYNRRHFLEHGDSEFHRARRYSQNLSVLLMDADHFKMINDSYGHAAGDHVLSELALIFRSELRLSDLLARYGGDEFVVMLVDADENQARIVAERIRKMVEGTPFYFESHVLFVRLSIGVAAVRIKDSDLGQLLDRADKAMYGAKSQGRNRVVVA